MLKRLKATISYFHITLGVTDFHAGGALGFDTFAAMIVIDLKRQYPNIRLILNLPYRNQAEKWSEHHARIYEYIMTKADEIVYEYDGYVSSYNQAASYLHSRNRTMVDCSGYCVAYYSGSEKSGTKYTVEYANKVGCEVHNLFDNLM